MSGDIKKIYISPLYVKETDKTVRIGSSEIRLRDFQYELLKIFLEKESKYVVLLNAPTGAGKTLSLVIPLLANLESSDWIYYGAVGLYPSRELAGDQMTSIANLLIRLGARQLDIRMKYKELGKLSDEEVKTISSYIKIFEVGFENEPEPIPIVLLYITSDSLKTLREVIYKYISDVKTNKDVLSFLWERIAGRGYRIVFTVPEYPYLAGAGVYQDFHKAGIWLYATMKELKRFLKTLESGSVDDLKKWFKDLEVKIDRKRVFEEYYTSRNFLNDLAKIYQLFRSPIFFDEFHLYTGFSLASFLSLFYILLYEKGVGKIVISSATPFKKIITDKQARDLLELIKNLTQVMSYSFITVKSSISTSYRDGYAQIRKPTLVKLIPIKLEGKHVTGAPAYGALQYKVPDVLKKHGWLEDYKKMGRSMIIVDRVASVLEISEHVERLTGEKPLAVSSVRDLLSETPSEWRGDELKKAKLVVGNMAIAFGIDIVGMDLGVVAAKDYLSALQKIGRFGRGAGDGHAVVYLPIPLYKYLKLKDELEKLNEKEIPYALEDTTASMSFIDLLVKLYPAPPPELLLRRGVGLFKIIFPVWVYVLATMIRLRDSIREALHKAGKIDDVEYIHRFVKLIREIEIFFGVRGLGKKVRRFMTINMSLTPIGLFNIYSYRSKTSVPVKRRIGKGDEVEDYVDIVTVGRNIYLKYENGEFYIDESAKHPYAYTNLRFGAYDPERFTSILEKLDGKVVNLSLLAELLNEGDTFLFQWDSQGVKKLCKIRELIHNIHLRDAPVQIFYVKDQRSSRARFVERLSAVDSMIPIYTVNSREEIEKLVGGIYIL